MWDFYLGGLRVKKRWPFSAPQGRASKNNLFREACARSVGEGECENRFIRMEIVPVSNEPIGGVAVPEHVFGRSANGLCFLQLLHIGVDHGNGRDVDHILHRTFKVGEVDGAI